MSSYSKVILKKGEAKILKFTITSSATLGLASATYTFGVKQAKSDTSYIIQKTDGSFDKSSASSSIIRLPLTNTDTDITAGTYLAELKTSFTDGQIDKSQDLQFVVQDAVIS